MGQAGGRPEARTLSAERNFVHPGIDQRAEDLALMKKKVLAGEQPWKGAFDRLQAAADTEFVVRAHTHVLRGPYGKPNIGGDDLSKSANMAYNYALVWYVTRDKQYAEKAIEILRAWSGTLWDLDYNDAKLLMAWTGHLLCNAAEILRYTGAGWQQKDIDAFSAMLNTVAVPLMRPYYPSANGNWDGAIIHSLLAIAVFTDNRRLFDNAVDHFEHGPVNGGILKYIYPSGQCQESPRDQGHVQLGIGEFAGAAQVAYTQGVDLFSMADNRIAKGFEYTARFLLAETPQCYCVISERAKVLRDDYEYVYRHYTAKGVDMPYVRRAADSVRPKASRSVLTAVRAGYGVKGVGLVGSGSVGVVSGGSVGSVAGAASGKALLAGAGAGATVQAPSDAIIVHPGESIQKALDAAVATGGKFVVVKAGIHNFPATLRLPSGVTLAGEGLATVLFLDPASGQREAMINADVDAHDITIRDLVIEASNKTEVPSDPNSGRSYRGGYNRGGILFRADKDGQMQRISLINLTVRNSTYSGVCISGASSVTVGGCDLSENGVNVPPGPKLLHNLLLTHCSGVKVTDSRLVNSPFGSGVALDHCKDVTIAGCEIARNGYYGILVTESSAVTVQGCLIEANDFSGVMAEFLSKGNERVQLTGNRIQYNNGYGVEAYAVRGMRVTGNVYEGNGSRQAQEKISPEKYMLLDK
ncbi:MAG: alginate lyase family protein [Bacteroidetes bacterium]|nr:alginate lyase family protein [Bacteroidota bacterium]